MAFHTYRNEIFMRIIGDDQLTMTGNMARFQTNLFRRICLLFVTLVFIIFFAQPSISEAATTILTLNHTNGEMAVGRPGQRKVVRDAEDRKSVV